MRRDPLADGPWLSIVLLSITVMTAFGIMFYGFSVYLTDAAAGSEFSTTVLSLGYGGAILSGGVLALPIGRFADRRGVRPILGLGAVLGFLGLAGFAAAQSPWQVIAVWWLLIGPAGAMTFYEPAFVAVDQWCTPQQRPRALATLTVIGGLAGVLFIPGTERLVNAFGWRTAALTFGLLMLVTAGGTALFGIPSRLHKHLPADHPSPSGPPLAALLRDPRFRRYTAAMMLTFFAIQGIFFHRVARFEEVGFAVAGVALWAAAASALSLPGRWVAPLIATRFRATSVHAAVTLAVAGTSLLMVTGTASWQMIGHFTLFGVGFGAMLPLRPMVMSDWYSGEGYGRVMGAQWTATALAGAAGPITVGVLRDQTGGYELPIGVLVVVLIAAAMLILASGRSTDSTSARITERR